MSTVVRVPRSTYRLQITPDFDLFAAARVLPYLRALGVDWAYLSPLLASEPGSQHGYDVVAFDSVDHARGGAEGLATLSAEARRLGMGVLVDIVPNHVGVATPAENPWWWDVLRHGQESEHATAFDVDWAAGDGRLRIPVVGDGDQPVPGGPISSLRVAETPDGGELVYHDHRYPVAPGTWRAGDDPDEVHRRQHYELVNWRVADHDLNYRRFFAVNTLAAVRAEDPDVFAASHREIRRWFDQGLVDGLRVDHPDGLRDPRRYLDDLADLTGGAYVVVEKILEPFAGPVTADPSRALGEELPTDWACRGTTGYEVLGLIDRALVDPAGQAPLDALDTRLRGEPVDWPEMVHANKRAVADGILHAEVRRITRELLRLVDTATAPAVEDAVAELIACFPVYRSYLPEGREHLAQALRAARARRPDLAKTLDVVEPALSDPWSPPAKRFQQTSGMVMAKGVEDCSFYRWSRLTSLNEVGGDPSVFALDPDVFHAAMERRSAEWPDAMTTLSTHDTKRGEDVRARIDVLAEVPQLWSQVLTALLEHAPLPDPGFGALLWQAAVGAWPLSRDRLHAYAEKAMREAGQHTTWTAPDEQYESAVHAAVDAAFDHDEVRRHLDRLLEVVVAPGWSNALAAKLLSITVPGVPDVYQGSELWEQSLVDPDNRRAIDFGRRASMLERLDGGEQPRLTGALDDAGAAKLHVTRHALTLRHDRPWLFSGYQPVAALGPAAEHALAFDRGGALTVVTRLPLGLQRLAGWDDTALELPPGTWRDVLTDRAATAEVAGLLDTYPVALLVREEP